jgi:hypothetical protein
VKRYPHSSSHKILRLGLEKAHVWQPNHHAQRRVLIVA